MYPKEFCEKCILKKEMKIFSALFYATLRYFDLFCSTQRYLERYLTLPATLLWTPMMFVFNETIF
jgi:hypothetical protein